MGIIQSIFGLIFNVNSVWSVVFRGVFWFAIVVVILISSTNPDADQANRSLKSNLGFFMMFLFLSGGLIYLLFGYLPGV